LTEFEYPSIEDLLELAAAVLRPDRPLLRDPGALAAAALRPQTTVFGDDAYPTLAEKAAALLHSIVRNHPLVDGNKRLGWVSMRWLCELNGFELHILDAEVIEQFVISVATGEMDVDEASKFVAARWSPLA
jgi:death-on-curing protein